MESRVVIFILTVLGVIGAMLVGVTVGAGDYFGPSVAIVLLASVALISTPEVAVFLSISLYASGLNAPGLSGQLGMFEIISLAVVGCAIIAIIFKRGSSVEMSGAHRLGLAFGLLLLATGLYRGLGIRFLGGDLWGGFNYIKVLLSIAFVFLMPVVNLRETWWRRAIVWMGVLALCPLVADLLVLAGFNYGLVRMFLQTGGQLVFALQSQETGEGVGRLSSAGVAAWTMMMALLASIHTRKLFSSRGLGWFFLFTAIILISFASGFRLMTASLIFAALLLAGIQGSFTLPRVAIGIVASLFCLAIVYQVADTLPYSAQRALSWLPGITISQIASNDASGTVSWRLDLWHEALKDVPAYFWIGKGFAFSGMQMERVLKVDPNGIDWALVSGAYHNGYLSLFLLTGIGGFIVGFALLFAITIRHWGITRKPWRNERLHVAHQAFLSFQITLLVTFTTIYGDLTTTFPQYFFIWAVMEGLRKADTTSVQIGSASIGETKSSDDYAYVE